MLPPAEWSPERRDGVHLDVDVVRKPGDLDADAGRWPAACERN
nr:hypothetical protein [Halopenitus malekzadehii]